ncbi:MAG TPA: dihydrodipicolinate reductase C-terminal domain-containing protein [Bacilli bacterium]|jgi:4-hydroxy-tetrahydrodipicolinate reductase|nr:dihydrodipicolinate reductase C-terminal domain-containing protein [Bacilli bacterium]HPX20317.1 dihydrodipicolinate reductase C-terminal domain-containing protein [Bacilli bacterium]
MSTWQMAVILMGAVILALGVFLLKKPETKKAEERKITVLICGINGKMGSFISESLAGSYRIIGLDPKGKNAKWPCFSDLREALEEIPDIMVDFAGAKGIDNLRKALLWGLPVVSGSTGFSELEIEELVDLAKRKRTSLIMNANFSSGISDIRELLIKVKDRYAFKITEAHHKSKKDAPSGTAKLLSRILGVESEKIEVVRNDDFTPCHTVELLKQGERITITHEVFDRSAYLKGIGEAMELALCSFIVRVNGTDQN